MDYYVIGFICLMSFLILVGVAAFCFISSEAQGKPRDQRAITDVKTIDTQTIETIDAAGKVQRWHRSP